MFLAIDAGNSNVVFALFDQRSGKWTNQFRLETKTPRLISQLSKKVPLYFIEHGIQLSQIEKIGFSSVVPEVNFIISQFCKNFFGLEPYLISPKSYPKLPVKSLRPNEIGSDLMCNVVAAFSKHRSPVIIVDFGTALTFTAVDKKGEILGVNIVPGLQTAIKALFSNTSKLPEVELSLPDSALGKNTIHAIQAGVLYGYTGLVKGMIEAIEEETKLKFTIIATGGLAAILTTLENTFDEVDRNLTLEGLRLISEANS
ncbi:type III pantothenate kinase [Algoriphagus boritolerans]|uniref:Type III pantothenate kinase n=1 Tax=Algoriphagus boritolerans DSM 17298 = JCM 18970 TaxID=1120964 RepID=A0A1H5XU01_9BACT|nr:type III pantothenate kinase [Algoriphagus boritolerans]SEG15133.1 type III pantothenate kinase [Algoriphagus boritolerans DSM 17298 = JCM 18970]